MREAKGTRGKGPRVEASEDPWEWAIDEVSLVVP